MAEGGICLPYGRGLSASIHFLPPGGDGERWDSQREVELAGLPPEEDESPSLGDLLFGLSPDTTGWYCEACQRAVAVFQKEVPWDPFPDAPNGPLPSEHEILSRTPPEPPPEPKPSPAPQKDPWEKRGLFRRKNKKPDWEL